MTDPQTDPPPASPPAIKPGYLTTEAWISFVVGLCGLIPSSGLVANAPTATQIVGIVSALVTTICYQIQRTSLKKTHVLALAQSAAASSNTATKATVAIAGSGAVGALVLALALPGATSAPQSADGKGAPAKAPPARAFVLRGTPSDGLTSGGPGGVSSAFLASPVAGRARDPHAAPAPSRRPVSALPHKP